MPTRSTLVVLFLFLVGVPVGTAAYLGTAGLDRERAMLVERERDALEQRANQVRDALVRELQKLYREERQRPVTAYTLSLAQPPVKPNDVRNPTHDYFQVTPSGKVELGWSNAEQAPGDVMAFAQGDRARALLDPVVPFEPSQTWTLNGKNVVASLFAFEGDLAYRGVAYPGGGRVVQGFRVDVPRLERRFLDPASPDCVFNRFDERLEDVRLVRDDPRRVQATGAHGLPQVLYRFVVPARNTDPVLLPAGHLLALSLHPAASLAGDLRAAEERLLWTLGIVGLVVALGMLFFWRALRAEARLAARKAEFVNAVSHELRTPLTSIRMYADMLKEGWVKDEQTARDYFALMSAESERLARLVNNVLDFSRIEKGKKSFEMQVGDPGSVVREVAEVLRPYLKDKGFELSLELPKKLPACTFDKDALTQILVNLIDNAVKYGEKEVRLEAEAVDGRVHLRVLDRGAGVPAAERERIFEAFTRGSNAHGGGGSGLGLALVRHYVTAHDGNIEVADREGGGAVFALSLPAA